MWTIHLFILFGQKLSPKVADQNLKHSTGFRYCIQMKRRNRPSIQFLKYLLPFVLGESSCSPYCFWIRTVHGLLAIIERKNRASRETRNTSIWNIIEVSLCPVSGQQTVIKDLFVPLATNRAPHIYISFTQTGTVIPYGQAPISFPTLAYTQLIPFGIQELLAETSLH